MLLVSPAGPTIVEGKRTETNFPDEEKNCLKLFIILSIWSTIITIVLLL